LIGRSIEAFRACSDKALTGAPMKWQQQRVSVFKWGLKATEKQTCVSLLNAALPCDLHVYQGRARGTATPKHRIFSTPHLSTCLMIETSFCRDLIMILWLIPDRSYRQIIPVNLIIRSKNTNQSFPHLCLCKSYDSSPLLQRVNPLATLSHVWSYNCHLSIVWMASRHDMTSASIIPWLSYFWFWNPRAITHGISKADLL
jgi:hypothetical protein